MPKKKAKPDLVNITVRMDRDLLERIRQAASRDDRSVNSFMNATARRQLQLLMGDQFPGARKRR